jgi:hypothetical protein
MKTISILALLLFSGALSANDSTARMQLKKAKNNAIVSMITTFTGSIVAYSGAINLDPATTNVGLVMICGGAILGTVATYQYYSAQIEARLGYKSVGLTIRF